MKRFAMVLSACVLFLPTLTSAAPVVFEASGAVPADIQSSVDDFRAFLGPLNPNVAGSFPSGRREINWDGVPDAFSAPNSLPADFFNVNSPRGTVYSTPGTGFQVSANAVNPSSAPIEFGNINPSYPGTFAAFTPQRLFTAIGSNITDVNFFVPGTTTAATTSAFGVMFTDVDLAGSTTIEYFDLLNNSLGLFSVPSIAGNETFSFLGAVFDSSVIARVRITSGNAALGPNDGGGVDLVVMDDFI